MTGFNHPYIFLRIRLAHRALLQFFRSLQSSLEILLGFAIGLASLIALPGLYAATLPWPSATSLILAQALLAAIPACLLRKRLLPDDVMRWLFALPLPASIRWRADIAVASILMVPLAIAYSISLAFWLYQWPIWLRPVALTGIAATAASLSLTWACSTVILALRASAPMPRRRRRKSQPAASNYVARALRPHSFFLWRQLFWLPCWRGGNVIGMQQSLLWLGAMVCMLAWVWQLQIIPLPVLGLATSVLMVLTTDRGDKAVREQITMVRPAMEAWPIEGRRVERWACLFSLLPALSVLCPFGIMLGSDSTDLSHHAALLYLGVACIAQISIVMLPKLHPRGRVTLLFLSILILTAIGSELWS